MTGRTPAVVLAEVIAGHELPLTVSRESRCGCGEYFGRDLNTLAMAHRHAAHVAAVVLAHLETEGWAKTVAEEFARFDGFFYSLLSRYQAENSKGYKSDTLVRRRVTDWEPA